VQLSIRLLIPPGSQLLALDEVQRLIGPLDRERLSYAWQHPDPRMDQLAAASAAVAEAGATAGEDPRVTFYKLRGLALAALAGRPLAAAPALPSGPRGRSPHLSEAWFC
jgi:hypothetical protein